MCDSVSHIAEFLDENSIHLYLRAVRIGNLVWLFGTVVVVLVFQLVFPFFVFSSRISRLGFFVCPAYLFLNRLHIRIGVTNSRDLLSLLLLLVSSACVFSVPAMCTLYRKAVNQMHFRVTGIPMILHPSRKKKAKQTARLWNNIK